MQRFPIAVWWYPIRPGGPHVKSALYPGFQYMYWGGLAGGSGMRGLRGLRK